MELNMNCHIVVDDLPDNVAAAKQAAFLKVFAGTIAKVLGKPPVNIKLVSDEASGNAIAAFIELASPAEADAAIGKLHGFAFTKTCKFSAYRWSDFEKAENTPDTLPEENEEEDGEAVRDMTNAFLLDEKARPQLLIKSGQDYDVTWSYFNTKDNRLDQIRSTHNNSKTPWCEIDKRNKRLQRPPKGTKPFPQWTSKGTYLISQHPTELCFWGGASMQLCAEVQCQAADFQNLVISNNEKYCIVKSRGLHFWNLVEGRLIRSIVRSEAASSGAAAADADADESNAIFQYSADDALVGTISRTAAKQGLSLYETDSMKIISEDSTGRFSLEVPGINSFFFNPANPKMLAYAVDGGSNTWRVHIDTIDVNEERVPRFVTLCRRQWMNLSAINLMWHPSGDYLCAKLTKILPNDKTYVEYCIFRTSTNSVSAELFDPKGEARRFVFSPTAPRFALLVVPSTQSGLIKRQYLQFFAIEPRTGLKMVGKFENEAEVVLWAPKGSRCVAVNISKSNIEFFGQLGAGPYISTGDMVPIAERNNEMSGLPNVHKLPTDFEWDPTGRYFISVSSGLQMDTDNLLSVWNVNGRIVFQQKMQRLSHATFRPLPKSLLTADDLAHIKKELANKSKEYDQQLLEEKQKADAKVQEKLTAVEEKYKKALAEVADWQEKEDFTAKREKLKQNAPMYKHLMEQAEAL